MFQPHFCETARAEAKSRFSLRHRFYSAPTGGYFMQSQVISGQAVIPGKSRFMQSGMAFYELDAWTSPSS